MLWLRTEHAVLRELDTGAVVMDLRSDRLMALNATGAALWEALGEPVSVETLAQALSARFAVAPDAARADAEAFLTSLQARGLARPQS